MGLPQENVKSMCVKQEITQAILTGFYKILMQNEYNPPLS